MVKPFRWAPLVWSLLGFLMFLSGFYSGNVVTATLGVALVFAGVSSFLALHVASESRLKKALEVFSAVGAVGIIVCGYFLTGSIILAIITALIMVLMSVAFLFSYLYCLRFGVEGKQLKIQCKHSLPFRCVEVLDSVIRFKPHLWKCGVSFALSSYEGGSYSVS